MAVVRTCRNYRHWWLSARQHHLGKDNGLNPTALAEFMKCIRDQKLFLTRARAWQWGAKLSVELANARLMIKQLTPRLSLTEKILVKTLRDLGRPTKQEELLHAAKLSNTGTYKTILAGLDDRGVMINHKRRGYHLPEWLL